MTEELSHINMTKVVQEEQCHSSSSLLLPWSKPLPDHHLQPFIVKALLGPSPAPFALPLRPPPNPLLLTFLKFAQSLAPSIATHSVNQNPSDVLCSVEVLD